jgi:hypothetical protein
MGLSLSPLSALNLVNLDFVLDMLRKCLCVGFMCLPVLGLGLGL